MFKRSAHKRLVANGAPALPRGYFYYPIVVFIDNARLLRMEIRRQDGVWTTEVARWTVDPATYFTPWDDGSSTTDKINTLCLNAATHCEDLEFEE